MIKLAAVIGILGVIIAKMRSIVAWVGSRWTRLAPVIVPIIQQVEQASLSGKIVDKSMRKEIALNALNLAQKQGLIKLGWLERMIVNMVIDKIASDLPDFSVSKQMIGIVDSAISELDAQSQGRK